MKAFALALFVLAGCSPLRRVVTGRCATSSTLAVDAAITAGGLALSVERYNDASHAVGLGIGAAAMGIAVAANRSECR